VLLAEASRFVPCPGNERDGASNTRAVRRQAVSV